MTKKEKKMMDLSHDPIRIQQFIELRMLKGKYGELKLQIEHLTNLFKDLTEKHGVDILRFGPTMGLTKSVSFPNRFNKALLEEKHPGLYDKCKIRSENPTVTLKETSKV